MMDYDSDLYYEHSEPKNLPVQSTKSQKRPRNLEDRVREYTGYVQVGSESTQYFHIQL